MRRALVRLLVVALAAASLAAAPAIADLAVEYRGQHIDAKAEMAFQLAEREAAMKQALGIDLTVPGPFPCDGTVAGYYPCENVDLLGYVPLAELGGVAGNDSWGWTDPETGNEIALVGTGHGLSFVDITEPTDPVVLGFLPSEALTDGEHARNATSLNPYRTVWRDVKVDGDHAFVVGELRWHGMQVFDLTRLRAFYGATRSQPENRLEPDVVWTGDEEAGYAASSYHNIAINTDADMAYLLGGHSAAPCPGDVDGQGLVMVDISDPKDPDFAGCFGTDGYTHDAHCVRYDGPDADHNGTNGVRSDICMAANEDSITIVDVTDPSQARELSRITYSTYGYAHQGWLTDDHTWFVFNDELDEDGALSAAGLDENPDHDGATVAGTTTYMVEVTDLDEDKTDADVARHLHQTKTIDHNLYIRGDLIFEANYNAGLRILRFTPEGLANGELEEVGYLDVDPGLDAAAYGGAWNVYPFFDSGSLVVSTLDEGLFVMRFNDPAAQD